MAVECLNLGGDGFPGKTLSISPKESEAGNSKKTGFFSGMWKKLWGSFIGDKLRLKDEKLAKHKENFKNSVNKLKSNLSNYLGKSIQKIEYLKSEAGRKHSDFIQKVRR